MLGETGANFDAVKNIWDRYRLIAILRSTGQLTS